MFIWKLLITDSSVTICKSEWILILADTVVHYVTRETPNFNLYFHVRDILCNYHIQKY